MKEQTAAYNAALGARIRSERLKRGWSQDYLGFRVSLTRTVITKIEAGTREVSAFEAWNFARAFELPVDRLTQNLGEESGLASRKEDSNGKDQSESKEDRA